MEFVIGIVEIGKEYGPMGLLSGLLVYQVWFLQGKMQKAIENNTAVLEKLKDSMLILEKIIDKCEKR